MKRTCPSVVSFSEAADLMFAEHRVNLAEGSHKVNWLSLLEKYANPIFGNISVSDIGADAINSVLEPLKVTKPETSRRVKQRIGSVIDWSCENGFRRPEQTMASLKRQLVMTPKRDIPLAALPYVKIPDYITVLRQRRSIVRLALEALILSTGRPAEIRNAKWRELDLEQGIWTIPAERTRVKAERVIPVSKSLTEVFRRVCELHDRNPDSLIFSGSRGAEAMCDTSMVCLLRHHKQTATPHGFRTSFREWALDRSAPLSVINIVLHSNVENQLLSEKQLFASLDAARVLLSEWGAFCSPCVDP